MPPTLYAPAISTVPSPNSTVPAPLTLAVLVVVIAGAPPSNPSVPADTRKLPLAPSVPPPARLSVPPCTSTLPRLLNATSKVDLPLPRASVTLPALLKVLLPWSLYQGRALWMVRLDPGQVVKDAAVLLVEVARLTEPTARAGVIQRAAVQDFHVTRAISGAQHQRAVGIDGPRAADRPVQPGQAAGDREGAAAFTVPLLSSVF